jgi:hypothetical protein
MYIDTYVMLSGMITILCVAVQGFQMGGDPPYPPGYNGKPNGKAQPKQPTRNPTPQPHGKPNPKPDSTAKRKPSGKPNGHVYTWQQFLDQLAQVVDTSEEKLLDVYLPSHPNSMFFENDSDVLPEHRHLPRYW